jgi:CheY-like chemotaxis protein
MAFVAKPVQTKTVLDEVIRHLGEYAERRERRVLLIEPDQDRRASLETLLARCQVEIRSVRDHKEAMRELTSSRYDCILAGPETSGLDAEALAGRSDGAASIGHVPVIVYGDDEETDGSAWKNASAVTTVKRAQSADRLLDQTAALLHRSVASFDEQGRKTLESLHRSDKLLSGRKVLIVDDDMRNIFALATVLEEHDMVIVSADNGRAAIRMLQETPDIDIVLMDIMMPEMDGIDTMREIRKNAHFKNLPIVAVTAKAMKGDREKCIEAGAWDYLAKPVDTEQLLGVLRAWLFR